MICDDSNQDFECELEDLVAVDFIFNLVPPKRYRIYFRSEERPFAEFKQHMMERLHEVLSDYTADEIAEDLILPYLPREQGGYRRSGRMPHNPYRTDDL